MHGRGGGKERGSPEFSNQNLLQRGIFFFSDKNICISWQALKFKFIFISLKKTSSSSQYKC